MTVKVAILRSALRGDTAFVHIICDVRMDLRTLLMRRLLRMSTHD
jgi:hypothetical protein